ncbi:hypothetical protein [Lelliottia steviae]|uniref:helix-turn-helix transcriptional regulator n=1 Tax=Pseudoalteromonas sp. TaxID=53249 RepID=UPI001880C045|nr:hypothetical protein [Lelliottia steviae]
MAKESKPQRVNPFKTGSCMNPRVDVFTSRNRSKSKLEQINCANSNISSLPSLDIDALVEGLSFIEQDTDASGFVNVPNNKQALHPATLFKNLYLTKAQVNGLDYKEVIVSLGIPEQQFYGFLNKEVRVTRVLASKLRMFTGMPDEFWLRVQAKFDSSYIEHTDCKGMEFFEITIHLNVGDPSLSMDDIDDRLYEAGFDDAFISHDGKGAISVSLERVALTEKELFDKVKKHLINLFPKAVWS